LIDIINLFHGYRNKCIHVNCKYWKV